MLLNLSYYDFDFSLKLDNDFVSSKQKLFVIKLISV